jgi:phage terminase large subunit
MNQHEVLYTRVFEENLKHYQQKKARVIGNQGSTRSTKTYSLMQLCGLFIPLQEKKQISIVSPSLPHLKMGARKDFLEIIEAAGIYDEANFNMTDQVYNYPSTGSYVEFFGVDNPGKVRGPGRDILVINEPNLIDYQTYLQLALRTREIIFMDFNPVEETSWVYDIVDSPDNAFIHSTYKDNPFLPKPQVQEIEAMKDADPENWKIFGLGLRGSSQGIIYTHWKLCKELPMKGELFFGQDFGYNVPSALCLCEMYEGAIYVQEFIYETRLTTTDLIERYKEIGVSKTIEIFCDNAEPKTIEELRRAGYNAWEANKDVTEGIRKVKSLPLFITENSSNIVKEIKGYKWKTDVNGRPVRDKDRDEPVKFNDHAMDAIRYAVFTKLHQDTYTWVAM